eukprot:1650917-Pyramimonas_sp.AAC.1
MAGPSPGSHVWKAALANRDAYPLDGDDIRRADLCCRIENELSCQLGTTSLCADDGINYRVFEAMTKKLDDIMVDMPRALDFLEVFAGQATISKQLRQRGYRATAVEKLSGRVWDNVTTVGGVAFVALSVCRLKVGATA